MLAPRYGDVPSPSSGGHLEIVVRVFVFAWSCIGWHRMQLFATVHALIRAIS